MWRKYHFTQVCWSHLSKVVSFSRSAAHCIHCLFIAATQKTSVRYQSVPAYAPIHYRSQKSVCCFCSHSGCRAERGSWPFPMKQYLLPAPLAKTAFSFSGYFILRFRHLKIQKYQSVHEDSCTVKKIILWHINIFSCFLPLFHNLSVLSSVGKHLYVGHIFSPRSSFSTLFLKSLDPQFKWVFWLPRELSES